MAGTDRRENARNSIQELAASLDLPTDLEILSERWNTVVRLGDSGVIAKAATLADLVFSDPHLAFHTEMETCSVLFERGAPVHRPACDGYYEVGNLPITLWHEVPGEMGEATESELIESLAMLHRCGDDLLSDRDWFSTITSHFQDVFPRLRDREVADPRTLSLLSDYYDRLMDSVVKADLPNGFIHGDAQRKNAIATDSGAVWIDFEECSYGPVAWDIACLTMNARFDTDRVLDTYADITGTARLSNSAIELLKHLRDIEAVTWMLAIQDEREPSFGDAAAFLLADVLKAAGTI